MSSLSVSRTVFERLRSVGFKGWYSTTTFSGPTDVAMPTGDRPKKMVRFAQEPKLKEDLPEEGKQRTNCWRVVE